MNQLPRSIDEYIEYLQQKSMSFPDKEAATDLFSQLSYSRLKYYCQDLIDQNSDGDYNDGTTFKTIIDRYSFDHNLRAILFDTIETIEVALRAKNIGHMSKAAGNGLWNLDSALIEDEHTYLCKAVNPYQGIANSVIQLCTEYAGIPFGRYGFPVRWEKEPLWK